MSLSQKAGEAIRPRSRCDLISFIFKQTNKQTKLKVNLMRVFSPTEVIRVQILRYRWLWLHSPAAHLSPCVLLHGYNSLRQSYRRLIFFIVHTWTQRVITVGPGHTASKPLPYACFLSSHLRGWKHFPQSHFELGRCLLSPSGSFKLGQLSEGSVTEAHQSTPLPLALVSLSRTFQKF